MTCANILLTIAAAVVFAFGVWPRFGSDIAGAWVIGTSTIIIVIVAWSGVGCKWCDNKPKKEAIKKKR